MAQTKRLAVAKGRAGRAKRAPGKARHGSVGVQIFEAVEHLVADEKLSRAEAFRRVAKESGRKVGTVSVNYYRLAHQRGAKLRTRKRGGRPEAGKRRTRRAASGRQSSLHGALRDVATLIGQLEGELRHLRQENARLAEIRKLLGKL